jgi:hypothetical protein
MTSNRRRALPGPSDDQPSRLGALASDLREAWRVELDQPQALELALFAVRLVREGEINVLMDEPHVALAAEILWDSGHCAHSEKLIYHWRRHLQTLLATDVDLDDDVVLALRVGALRLSARSAYRLPNKVRAWDYIRAAYFLLRDGAGGEAALSATVAANPFTGIGRLYVQLLGIAIPVAARVPATLTEYHSALFLRDAEAVIDQLVPNETAGPPHHPLVSQFLLVVLRRHTPVHDTRLVQRLWVLEHHTRPKDARGQVTLFAMWAEVAEYFGETVNAKAYRARAHKALTASGMRRRARVMGAGQP